MRVVPEGIISLSVFEIYNRNTDVDLMVTADLKEALLVCGDLVDDEDDIFHDVYVYHNMTIDQYYVEGTVGKTADHYDVKDFIAKFSIFENTKEEAIDTGIASPEVYHNLSEEEKLEVISHVSDTMLINELKRRLIEYRVTTDAVSEAVSNMMIFV